uniref:Phosphatidic acid phosphatase type 2/haloperoxidase domain-containing protein n=1 Tax=Ananas comosus var. bracteatus TaxID=296719 RepID=A0A6V7QUB3_ANACO
MREAQLVVPHTVRSHGAKLARTHVHDWVIIAFLAGVVIGLNVTHPFYRFVGKDMMADFKYPHKSNTIPFWAVLIVAYLVPLAIFVAFYSYRKDVYDLHHATLGILFSGLITGVTTNAIKIAVGRPRPDFFWRCFPDGKELYDQVTGRVICHGDKLLMKDGHKSFPSGHTSWAFAGLCFLALYLSGKIKVFDRRGHVAKLCISFLPLLVASLVAVSRVDDYRHHWEDVFAGGLIGMVVATLCYLQFFPAPYDPNGWGPYAYFQMLAEAHSSDGSATNTNQREEAGDVSESSSRALRTSECDLETGIKEEEEPLILLRHRISDTMPDIQLGAHTVRSHGSTVARFHMYDWIILICLAVLDGVLNIIEPFHRFVGQDMMTDLRYPLKGNTVPFGLICVYLLQVIAIVLPFVIIIGIYFVKKNVYDLHNAILGLLFSVLITAVITDAIKDGVGRPRPDFFWRCFPDGKAAYDNVTTSVICHGEKSVIREGHKSFPSGHTSWSFAGLGFLAWYLAGKIAVFDRRGHVAKLCIVFLPLLVASLVAVSRVDDYWHHWQDVFAGGLLGLVVASFCYLQFFPPPYDIDAFWPHAYFQELAETGNNGPVSSTTNPFNLRPPEIETTYVSSDSHLGVNLRDTSPILDSMESGRRQ